MIDLRQFRANTARRFGSADHYHVGWVIGEVKQFDDRHAENLALMLINASKP